MHKVSTPKDSSDLLPASDLNIEQNFKALVKSYGSPLLLLDCEVVREQYRKLHAALPGVDMHYAIKALPHPAVIETLNAEGSYFDIATSGEIKLLKTAGISAQRTLHTHPIKHDLEIRKALDYGCTTFVVDNADEIEKFLPYRSRVSLLLRLSFRSPNAVVDLSKKFGCNPTDVLTLLKHGREHGLSIRGLTFHVGSQCASSQSHVDAIRTCLDLFVAAGRDGFALDTLDIGGGFPVPYSNDVIDIEAFCQPIRFALNAIPKYIRIIAEPGRYIAGPAIVSISSVIGKAKRDECVWFYLDDGVYGSYSGKIYDHASYPLSFITTSEREVHAVIAGPTCDSIDIVAENVRIPDLQISDLVIGRLMGAYSLASATDFNSLPKARCVVLNEQTEVSAWSVANSRP